ncbi:ABC transporter ATP-binding protein [Halobellus rubicundus]|uniref:Molybdate/tungstate import ATP-binding protein WtpC n=1 Tax=Halobellus rubicundus TaxID=2996466 RepID=A0ABD5MEN9_9EURY
MELTLDGVRKAYGETTALGGSGGIDLQVNDGEFFTLVGPSGCGKTTTLRLVAGFEPPTAGEIRFDGREMRGVPPEDRGVGVVFQNYALFPHLSVAENVAYGLRFADPPGGEIREERVASLLELVDLPDAGDRDPNELSGGQQQRVALARALAPGPDLLLLDEPMSALDARLRERLRMQVKEIQSELGITTVYVTHDQEEALAISDRVAVMNDGEVAQVGTPRDVYRRPATRFVANFVGDNNVFEGTVVDVDIDIGTDVRGVEGIDTEIGAGNGNGDSARTGGSGDEPGKSPGEREGFGAVAVDVGGKRMAVTTERAVDPGDRVLFCVRPESMRVFGGSRSDESGLRSSASSGSENILDATVSNAEFLGESTRSYLAWRGRELTVRTVDPLNGDVRVGFDPAAAHVVEVGDSG